MHSGMCVGKEPSLNLNGVSALSLLLCTCISAVIGVRRQVWNFPLPSVKPAQKVSFSFPIFRFEKLDFYQASLIHTGNPTLEHTETQSNDTLCLSFKDGVVSRLERNEEREQNCPVPCVFNTKRISVTDLNYSTAGYTQAAQINQSIRQR